jgi:hypothetical protein
LSSAALTARGSALEDSFRPLEFRPPRRAQLLTAAIDEVLDHPTLASQVPAVTMPTGVYGFARLFALTLAGRPPSGGATRSSPDERARPLMRRYVLRL